MKSNLMKKIIVMIFGILIFAGTTCFAGVEMPTTTTEVYDNWNAIANTEKQNYIQPPLYSLKIDDSLRKSTLRSFNSRIGAALPGESFNLQDDIDFEIKDQMNTNECWAFVTTNILETNVAKTRNKKILLSPRHIDYATSRTFLNGVNSNGFNRELGFGNYYVSLAYCTNGQGPVLEEQMPFEDNADKIELNQINIKPALKVEDYVAFANIYKNYSGGTVSYTDGGSTQYTESEVNTVRNLIKNHIKTYGSVTAYTYLNNDLTDYIGTTGGVVAYYNNDNTKQFNHGITIIGWNDNFPKEYFKEGRRPSKDGAYLVLNTSISGNDILSLMAVSYEDVWIEYQCFGVVSTSDIDYDKLYQYDEYGYSTPLTLTNQSGDPVTSGYIANVFEREEIQGKDEFLNEVSIYITKTSNVDIYLNTTNDDKTAISKVASAGILEPGYHTIKLSTPVKLTGNKFVVAAKLTNDGVTFATETNFSSNGLESTYWDYATSDIGQSFISTDGESWSDLTESVVDSNICLKAFSTYQKEESIKVQSVSLNKDNVEMQEGEKITLVATINPINAENKNVLWTSDNTETAIVSDTGIITAIKEGVANITVTTADGNKIAVCKVVVKGKIQEEDKIYYPDEEEKINKDGNKNQQLDVNIGENKDSTVAGGIIPKTGEREIKIVVIVAILILTSVIISINIIKYKEIK